VPRVDQWCDGWADMANCDASTQCPLAKATKSRGLAGIKNSMGPLGALTITTTLW